MNRLEIALIAAVTAAARGGRRVHPPEAGVLIWQWFADLSRARSYGSAGPNPVGYAEIDAYARLHALPLHPHHIALLRAMDEAWLHAVARPSDSFSTQDYAYAPPIGVAAFDAVFG